MIKGIVFDLDGMVLKRRGYFSARMQKKLSVAEEKITSFFQKELKACQRGKLDMKKVLEEKYFSTWGWEKSFKKFINWWFNGEVLNKEIVKIIKENKQVVIKSILLTNNEKYRLEFIINKFKLNNLFDFIIYSYEVGAIKPEKKYFDALLKVTKLLPEEILICDDSESRLKGVAQFGFKVYLYKNIKELIKFLKENKILNN